MELDPVEAALLDVLARADAGEEMSAERIRDLHPGCGDRVIELMEFMERLDAIAESAISPPLAPAPDTKLRSVDADRYADFRVLGEGGMGIVYWALDTDLNREVALKVVRPEPVSPGSSPPPGPIGLAPPTKGAACSQAFERLKARFLQEAWVTAGLEHPGIVPVYEVGRTPEGVPYYTMRFVRGSRTLATAIADAKDRPIEERLLVLDPFLKVCDTVRYAHSRGVIHRDLKPDNVALGEFGEVVVLDWGLAKVKDRPDEVAETCWDRLAEYRATADVRTRGRALGTPGYMSPEAARGRVKDIDARSDVYSLGAILYQILTGRLPYDFATLGDLVREMDRAAPAEPCDVDPSVPHEISEICARALSRDAASRQETVDALAAAIREWTARRARDREIEGLLREADAAMAATEGLCGDALLRQLDRVHVSATKVLERRPGHDRATGLVVTAQRLREAGICQRERAARNRVLRRLVLALAATLVVALTLALGATPLTRSRALTDQARTTQTLEPAKALRLAVDAVRLEPANASAANQLRRALANPVERAVLRGHTAAVTSAVFSRSGDRVLTTSEDGTARVWDVEGQRPTVVLRVPGSPIVSAEFTPQGDRIVSTSASGMGSLWDLSGALLGPHPVTLRPAVSEFVSPDGALTVSRAADGVTSLRDRTGKELRVLDTSRDPILTVEWAPGGTTFLTGTKDGVVHFRDRGGDEIAVRTEHAGCITSAHYAPNGTLACSTCSIGVARVWTPLGQEVAVLRGHSGRIESAAFSPDARMIVTASRDRTARIWDLGNREPDVVADARGLRDPAAAAREARIGSTAADGSTQFVDGDGVPVASVSTDLVVHVAGASGRAPVDLTGHANTVLAIAFTASGDQIVTGSRDKTARVWNAKGAELAMFRGHDKPVTCVAVSRAGDVFATASEDGTVRMWNLDEDELAQVAIPPRWNTNTKALEADPVQEMFFTPAGDRLVTVQKSGTARSWRVRVADLLECAEKRLPKDAPATDER